MIKLYNKYRVQSLDDLVGDLPFINKLKEDAKTGWDHTYMFYGEHGISKTSVARIIGNSLPDCYIEEISSSVDNGVATSKAIARNLNNLPLGYSTKLIILDEIQKASSAFFDALLKATEETGDSVYFCLCTTEFNKIPKNIKSRFTKLKFEAPDLKSMRDHLQFICDEENIKTSKKVLTFICKKNKLIPRDCISDLELIIGIDDIEVQLDLLENTDVDEKSVGFALAQLLNKGNWNKVSELLLTVSESDVEGIRRIVLNYFMKTLLNGNEKGAEVIEEFESPFFDSGKAGLCKAFWDCM